MTTFEDIVKKLTKSSDITAGNLFGKPCIKVNGKAFVASFKEDMAFKLTGKAHEKALALKGSKLWDPSGKKRPMKEWVQIHNKYSDEWLEFAKEAKNYVKNG